jgi:ABC-type transport system substrate-binding protein
MYDSLVGYRRTGGPEGSEVVADLATSIPVPTQGGRTYVFQLRRGIRYSNGQLVRPADFRYGMERVFKVRSLGRFYYEGIVGAETCLSHPQRCDLSKGIVTNDSARTVTYNLVRPDADFLDKLALPGGAAVPSGTPNRDLWPHAPPATGPYKIVVRKHAFVLTRNRYFHVCGPLAARATCQVLPPGFQSYRPHCPYTLHSNGGGKWTAPNLREARKLIAASGTSGTRITVWAGPVLGFDKVARYLTSLLDSLGYRATIKLAANYAEQGSPVVKPPGVQLTIVAWIPDYRAASDFFGWGWCNWGYGWFCDPSIDRQMRQAAAAPDRAVATPHWTQIDHRIVDLAPVIPVYNLNALDVLSSRVGNYQFSPILRVLLEQMWVR